MDIAVIFQRLTESFVINIELFGMTLLFGLPLGLVIAFGSMSKWQPFEWLPGKLKRPDGKRWKKIISILVGAIAKWRPISWLTKIIVWIVRGTPLMLQVVIIFYVPSIIAVSKGLPSPWGSGRLLATGIAFIINYACYFSEIYRGGIESIHGGQNEAGQVLGMTRSQIFFKVTLLQVVKRIVPPMGNEIITLIKDTSLARIIANKEIIMMAQEYSAKGLIWPLFSTALFFLVFVGILTLALNWSERRLSYFR
ncbi:MAG: amino acid ABC transporter permease [Oscillospiraceae bacterium]|jgi:polar amino acid transport system permease protein|nr:amino acid ABC transporter permease [Oscillospiraceae bacterium]